MEDMADLADMRQLLMERVQGIMATCCEFRNSLERYSYLYVDDRREFMRQFLLYGHVLSSQEAEGFTDDGVSESPPTLENFREQVDRWVLWSMCVCLCVLSNVPVVVFMIFPLKGLKIHFRQQNVKKQQS